VTDNREEEEEEEEEDKAGTEADDTVDSVIEGTDNDIDGADCWCC
jgi:hypothetical protein